MLPQSLENFNKQLEFKPEIINGSKLELKENFILIGMGGSHLEGDLAKSYDPGLPLSVYADSHLPSLSEELLKESTIILSSFSGNTQEILNVLKECLNKNLTPVVISSGGVLLDEADKKSLPYIKIPTDISEPRLAIGYLSKAILKILNKEEALSNIKIDLEALSNQGQKLAKNLKGFVPVIYSSQKNYGIAYAWKMAFNETSRIPSFISTIPEASHPDLNGLDIKNQTKELSSNLKIVFLMDPEDELEIQEKLNLTKEFYEKDNLNILEIPMVGQGYEKIFSSILLSHWIAFYLDKEYGIDPNSELASEEFKKISKN